MNVKIIYFEFLLDRLITEQIYQWMAIQKTGFRRLLYNFFSFFRYFKLNFNLLIFSIVILSRLNVKKQEFFTLTMAESKKKLFFVNQEPGPKSTRGFKVLKILSRFKKARQQRLWLMGSGTADAVVQGSNPVSLINYEKPEESQDQRVLLQILKSAKESTQ